MWMCCLGSFIGQYHIAKKRMGLFVCMFLA